MVVITNVVFCNVKVVNSPSGQIPPIDSGFSKGTRNPSKKAFRFRNDSTVPRPVCLGGFKMFVGVSSTHVPMFQGEG